MECLAIGSFIVFVLIAITLFYLRRKKNNKKEGKEQTDEQWIR